MYAKGKNAGDSSAMASSTTMTTMGPTTGRPSLTSFKYKVEGGAGDQTLSINTEGSGGDKESVSSFTDIVQFDSEGHPTIDINRLVYIPNKTQAPHLRREKLIWYVPDFCFILTNLLSLGVSTYFILAGITSLSWVTSIGMFSLPDCKQIVSNANNSDRGALENFFYLPCKDFMEDREGKFQYKETGYDFNQDHHDFPILQTKLTSVQTFGMILIGLQLINILNVMVGIHACLQGYKSLLVNHIAVDGAVVLGEYLVCSIVSFTGICEDRQLEVVGMMLRHHIRWYGHVIKGAEEESDKEKLLNLQVDALQLNLGCCGVNSWMDYLDGEWPYSHWSSTHEGLDDTESVIPFSCCQRWWIRNIYCSVGAHLWVHPGASEEKVHQFKERIVQEGCLYKLSETCERLKLFMGLWGLFATNLFLFFLIVEAVAALILIRNINNLIIENKKLIKRKEMAHDQGDSDENLDPMLATATNMGSAKSITKLGGKDRRWSMIAPPTEDEILTIKQRSNFNRFMAHIKGGFVEKWMTEAQSIVTEGQEESKALLAQTQEERKQKEKELLHKKKDHDHKEHHTEERPSKEEEDDKKFQHRKTLGVPSHKVHKMPVHKRHEGDEEDEEKPMFVHTKRPIGVPSHKVRPVHHHLHEDEEERHHKPPPLSAMPSRPSLKKSLLPRRKDSKVQWKPVEKKRIEKSRSTRKAIKKRAKSKSLQQQHQEDDDLDLLEQTSDEDDQEFDEEEQQRRKQKKRRRSRRRQLRRARKKKLEEVDIDRTAKPWIKYF